MDRMRDFADDRPDDRDVASGNATLEDDGIDAPMVIGTDERRMHVRAYNHWVSLLGGRAYPSVDDLQPANDQDFGPHSVLLDFTSGVDSPVITWLGVKLRAECGLPGEAESIADVPPRSLLSRLTDHYLQIIANRAPVGFEAEFLDVRGINTMYRGILLPLSSDEQTIDFIYGVINWKEIAPAAEAEALEAEIAAALADHGHPHHRPAMPVWADGPSAAVPDEDEAAFAPVAPEGEGLADWLAAARASAGAALHADGRGRAALYHALGQAYDFALLATRRADEYSQLLEESGIVAQARAAMTPVVKLVFGTDYDKTRLTEFAAALSYAQRHALPAGGMRHFLDQYPGGLKAVVAADRRERRPVGRPPRADATHEAARALEPQAMLALPGDDEFVMLVARRLDAERVAIIGVVPGDKPLLDRALKAIID